MSRRKIQGSKIWITGASSGIGAALALECAQAGAELVLSARRVDALAKVAQRCREAGAGQVHELPADLALVQSHEQYADAAWKAMGGLDCLVHNAGVGQRSTAAKTSPQVVDQIMNVNFLAPVNLTRHLLPRLRQRKNPQVVVIASVTAYLSTPMRSTYAASKHAVRAWFDALRAEEYAQGLSVTVICPGFVRTEFSRTSLTGDSSQWGKMDRGQEKGMAADRCARKILKAMGRGRREMALGGMEVFGVYLKRFLPGVFALLIRNKKFV